jgi:hypothetical protein
MQPSRRESLQQDFDSLDLDGVLSNETTLTLENMDQDSDCTKGSSEAKQLIDDQSVSVMELCNESFDSFVALDAWMDAPSDITQRRLRSSIFELSQQPSTNVQISETILQSAEPIRALHPSPSTPRPKRFYRTFWRGITARAVALDGENKSISSS